MQSPDNSLVSISAPIGGILETKGNETGNEAETKGDFPCRSGNDRKLIHGNEPGPFRALSFPSVTVDTREPWPHPWADHLPDGWTLERGTLETGDLCLSALPDGAIVERKTATDLIGCMTKGRDRFERELARSRYAGRFVVVVEADLPDVLRAARGMSESSVIGTLAAWQRRYTGFVFAGSVKTAAQYSWRFLGGQVKEIQQNAKALSNG